MVQEKNHTVATPAASTITFPLVINAIRFGITPKRVGLLQPIDASRELAGNLAECGPQTGDEDGRAARRHPCQKLVGLLPEKPTSDAANIIELMWAHPNTSVPAVNQGAVKISTWVAEPGSVCTVNEIKIGSPTSSSRSQV